MRFSEKRFADQPNRNAGSGRFNGRAQSGSARTDDQNVVV
jgi:hypothetical protein